MILSVATWNLWKEESEAKVKSFIYGQEWSIERVYTGGEKNANTGLFYRAITTMDDLFHCSMGCWRSFMKYISGSSDGKRTMDSLSPTSLC